MRSEELAGRYGALSPFLAWVRSWEEKGPCATDKMVGVLFAGRLRVNLRAGAWSSKG